MLSFKPVPGVLVLMICLRYSKEETRKKGMFIIVWIVALKHLKHPAISLMRLL